MSDAPTLDVFLSHAHLDRKLVEDLGPLPRYSLAPSPFL